MMKKNVYETMENDIMNAQISEVEKNKLLKNVLRLKENKVNILITGATGSGKSSTINALFDMEIAKVGVGVDPETMEIERYDLDNLILWDSPGLGDGKEADNRHAKGIIRKLSECDEHGNALIDLVLVILDGSTKDLGTSYELINNVIIPNLGKGKESRILVALNQADMAMKGRYWDFERNEPQPTLKNFLNEKVASIRQRIKEGTGVEVEPIYYSAGFKEEGCNQCKPYNLSKLLYYIVKATPAEKRIVYANNINEDDAMWEDDDELVDYGNETRNSILQAVIEGAAKGSEIGEWVGSIFGETGRKIGKLAGGIVGGICGIITSAAEEVFDFFTSWF